MRDHGGTWQRALKRAVRPAALWALAALAVAAAVSCSGGESPASTMGAAAPAQPTAAVTGGAAEATAAPAQPAAAVTGAATATAAPTASTEARSAAAVAPATALPTEGPAFGPGVHDFTLPTALGGDVSLRDYLGEKHVVLVFYRGFW